MSNWNTARVSFLAVGVFLTSVSGTAFFAERAVNKIFETNQQLFSKSFHAGLAIPEGSSAINAAVKKTTDAIWEERDTEGRLRNLKETLDAISLVSFLLGAMTLGEALPSNSFRPKRTAKSTEDKLES